MLLTILIHQFNILKDYYNTEMLVLFFSFLILLLKKAKSMESCFSMSKCLEFKCIEIFRLNIFF